MGSLLVLDVHPPPNVGERCPPPRFRHVLGPDEYVESRAKVACLLVDILLERQDVDEVLCPEDLPREQAAAQIGKES